MGDDSLMMLGYLAPMAAVLALFWNVARKLGNIESELDMMREQNRQLTARIDALRDLLSVVLDSRRERA